MGVKTGTHLGGIRTLEDLKGRCRIDEHTGCWLWSGSLTAGYPRVFCIDPETGKGRCMTGARAAWILGAPRGPEPIPAGKLVYRWRCKNTDCVNRSHHRLGTKAEQGKWQKANGYLRGDLTRVATIAAAQRRLSKLTAEDVHAIRASDEMCRVVGERFGVSPTAVSNIRLHKRWRDLGASVFTWRPA
jgi:hypothetical protein